MIAKGGFTHVAFALIKRIAIGSEHEDVLQCHEQAHRLDTLDTISLLKIPDVNQKIIA